MRAVILLAGVAALALSACETLPDDDGPDPVLIPGNPVKLSNVAEGPETRVPWVGEHTDDVLRAELGLDDTALADLRSDGVIN